MFKKVSNVIEGYNLPREALSTGASLYAVKRVMDAMRDKGAI